MVLYYLKHAKRFGKNLTTRTRSCRAIDHVQGFPLPIEVIERLEKIVISPSPFGDNKNLLNLLLLAAIGAEKGIRSRHALVRSPHLPFPFLMLSLKSLRGFKPVELMLIISIW